MFSNYRAFLLGVLLLVFFAYVPGLNGPLLFDSPIALTQNPQSAPELAIFDSWRIAAFSSDSGVFGRPVAMLTFAAQYVAAGDWVIWQLKLGNVLLHLLIGGLLYALFSALLLSPQLRVSLDEQSRRWVAVLAVAMWLSHPLFVSTTLYVVQRMAQFSTLFVLLGLLVYVKYRNQWLLCKPRLGEWLALGLWQVLIVLLALLSKENGILLLWLIPVVEVCFFRGVIAGVRSRWLELVAWIALVTPVLMIILVCIGFSDWFERAYEFRDYTLIERVMTQGRVLWSYLLWTILPNTSWMGLHHDDIAISRSLFSPFTTLLAAIAWPAVLVVAIWFRNRQPLWFFAVLFYLIAHSMESSIIGLELVFEHRNYLPLMGVFLLLSYVLVVITQRWRGITQYAICTGVVAILLSLTLLRSLSWSDPLVLAAVSVENHPDSARTRFQYGTAILSAFSEQEKGMPAKAALLAKQQFEHMLKVTPHALSAPVALLVIDSTYSMPNASPEKWASFIAKNVKTTILSAQDRNALRLLVKCAGENQCRVSDELVIEILTSLSARFPNHSQVPHLFAEFLSYRPERIQLALSMARKAFEQDPANPRYAYTLLGLLGETGRTGEASLVAAEFLKYDLGRHELLRIKSLFGSAP